jgi:hypothetical protein
MSFRCKDTDVSLLKLSKGPLNYRIVFGKIVDAGKLTFQNKNNCKLTFVGAHA